MQSSAVVFGAVSGAAEAVVVAVASYSAVAVEVDGAAGVEEGFDELASVKEAKKTVAQHDWQNYLRSQQLALRQGQQQLGLCLPTPGLSSRVDIATGRCRAAAAEVVVSSWVESLLVRQAVRKLSESICLRCSYGQLGPQCGTPPADC